MPNKRSTNLKQKLQQIAGIAYERELTAASESLLQEFQRWKNNEIDVFDLNSKIHEFHNGISRTLYTRYSGMDATFGIASALHRGILSREEVGEDVFISVEGITMALSSHH